MRRRSLLLPVVLALLAVPPRAVGEGSVTCALFPGVRASLKHMIVVEQETWPSALAETRAGREALRLEEAGGFRLHVRVRETPGDYVVCVVYVDEGSRLVLDGDSRLVLSYGLRRVRSTEILLTDDLRERRVFSSASDGPIVLTADATRYAKAASGGFLMIVRFPDGTLPSGRDWLPDSFELRGGEGSDFAQNQDRAGAADGGRDTGRRVRG
jgi:hypothetical protein